MQKINQFGNGLSVLILCEATGADNFMAFASVYSFQKNLPDARLVLACRRPEKMEFDVLPWVYKLGIPFFYYQKTDPVAVARSRGYLEFPLLTASCNLMCLEPLEQDVLDRFNDNEIVDAEQLSLPAKSTESRSLCSLKEGCGSFVPSSWIHKSGHPFGQTSLYGRLNLTKNEKRVFSLWKNLCLVYDSIL